MGNLEASDALIVRRQDILGDASLPELPGKVEETPASNRRSRLQGVMMAQLSRQLIGGAVLPGCSVLTAMGVRCPDVAWASPEFMAAHGESTPYARAPEICAEIFSPSNGPAEADKRTRLYLAAGAYEVWIVSEEGTIRYFGAAGEKPKSAFPLAISLPPPIRPAS
jgi:Putative restriction endonuclease